MDALLAEAFEHHLWANRELIAFCRRLTPEQLQATAPATYGSIVATLNHIVASDAGYLPRKKVERPPWAGDDENLVGLDALAARVEETAPLWRAYLADPLPPADKLELDGGAYQANAAVPIVQALHHGNVHRENVCTILTSLGFEPPDLQAWAWAEATGRAREVG
jgi:uncharacterized damage-inducible protein DinB